MAPYDDLPGPLPKSQPVKTAPPGVRALSAMIGRPVIVMLTGSLAPKGQTVLRGILEDADHVAVRLRVKLMTGRPATLCILNHAVQALACEER